MNNLPFGGTAATYVTWTRLSDVFTENKVKYITVQNPKTALSKKVRWYADKEHHDLYQPSLTKHPFAAWGFESDDDYVLAIPAEKAGDLSFNWKKNCDWENLSAAEQLDRAKRCWTYKDFKRGIWTAPKNAIDTTNPYIYKLYSNEVI